MDNSSNPNQFELWGDPQRLFLNKAWGKTVWLHSRFWTVLTHRIWCADFKICFHVTTAINDLHVVFRGKTGFFRDFQTRELIHLGVDTKPIYYFTVANGVTMRFRSYTSCFGGADDRFPIRPNDDRATVSRQTGRRIVKYNNTYEFNGPSGRI